LVAFVAIVVVGVIIVQIANRTPETGSVTTMTPSRANPVVLAPTETTESPTQSQSPVPTATFTVPATNGITPTDTATIPSITVTSLPISGTPIPTVTTLVIVEGPITNIVDNVITIFDFNIEVEPEHPILSLIDTDDVVRVEGTFGSGGVVLASVVSNIPSETIVSTGSTATVNLDGPIEAINGNVITVNQVPVQIDPADPILQTLQVGNFVSVQGNFVGSGSTIVLVVVNITIVNNVLVETGPFCWYHDTGMGMGHWHCDGMGMGMGMGDDGMGMGG
jgi:hypothetical protein